MPGLPHFTNSLAATKYYEPFYQNLFEVSILPPPTVAGGEILLEHVRKIGGLTEQKMEATVEQKYKFAQRSYAKSAPDSTVDKTSVLSFPTSPLFSSRVRRPTTSHPTFRRARASAIGQNQTAQMT